MITDTNNIFPRDFRTLRKQISSRNPIYLMDSLTYRFDKHTISSQFLHSFWRQIVIINRFDRVIPFLQLFDGFSICLKIESTRNLLLYDVNSIILYFFQKVRIDMLMHSDYIY